MSQAEKHAYAVLSSLTHDGEKYYPGIDGMDVVELTPKQAKPLLGLNPPVIAVPVTPDVIESDAGHGDVSDDLVPRPEDQADVNAAIIAVIESLDKSDKSLWTADGKTPTVAAIENALGWIGGVSAADRDAAL